MKCKCEEAELGNNVVHMKLYLIDGSPQEHGRKYCATGGPAFWKAPAQKEVDTEADAWYEPQRKEKQ